MNASDESTDLAFRSGKIADVVVSKADAEVWRWSEGRMFTQAIETETLLPGESLTHQATWEDPPPREYTATALLEASEARCMAQASFEIP